MTVNIPAILNELQAAGINEPIIKAYILATAEHESPEGRVMTEKITP